MSHTVAKATILKVKPYLKAPSAAQPRLRAKQAPVAAAPSPQPPTPEIELANLEARQKRLAVALTR
ncbi:MAG: hypothetical protein LBR11_08635 [Deltaproteobacteria bacterium]|jgi:hypothetical protein|nr:hypothetical protein [Deltaproteobacteria bacterium]